MLLLWGHVGTGKSTWAQYAAIHEDLVVAHWTPGDSGSHTTQKLDFWLKTQPAMDLRGKLMVVILDDVEELFRDGHDVTKIKVNCPIIATAGPSVSANLRNRASLALHFGRIGDADARKVVQRIRPQSDRSFAEHVQKQAGGDLRQLMIKASSNGLWCRTGSSDLYETGLGRAVMVLNSDVKLRGEEWDYKGSRSDLLIHHNFIKCCPEETFLVRYTGFLLAAAALDSTGSVKLMAFAARGWRGRKSGDNLASLPLEMIRVDDEATEEPTCVEIADDRSFFEIRQEKESHWVYRRPSFKPGLHFACELLRKQLGGAVMSAEQRRHEVKDSIEVACLSPNLRLGTDHIDDLLDSFHSLA